MKDTYVWDNDTNTWKEKCKDCNFYCRTIKGACLGPCKFTSQLYTIGPKKGGCLRAYLSFFIYHEPMIRHY